MYFFGQIFEQNFFLAAKTVEGHGMKIISFKAKIMVIRLVNCVCEEQIKLAWLILVISAMVIVFFGHIFVQKVFVAGKTVERRGMEIISFN